MIRKLKVSGLNDQFDYEFEFNKDLNIFTGVNGRGKTTLLKLIWYLISGNLHRIAYEIPFKSVSIETDQFRLSLAQFQARGAKRFRIKIDWSNKKKTEEHVIQRRRFDKTRTITFLNRRIASIGLSSLFFPTFRRIEGGFSIHKNAGHSSPTEMLQTAMSRISEDLSTEKHRFITSVLTKDIEELLPLKKAEIADKVNELYAELSRRIGKEVPSSDTLQTNDTQAISALTHIQEDLIETGKERQKLENRMTVLDEMVQIIFEYEKIQIAKGILLGKKTDSKKAAIRADKLSSGEKQMLGFLCYNAFSDNTAIFIDEPELSLHQDWQDILLPLLLKQETGNQFFVATHSELIYDQFPDKEHILNLEGN